MLVAFSFPEDVPIPIDDEVGSGGNEQVPPIPSPNPEVISNEPNARRLKSAIWQHFGRIEITKKINGKGVLKVKAVCKYCKKTLVGRLDDGTSHLHRRLKLCLSKPSIDKSKQQLLRIDAQTKTGLGFFKFEQKKCQEALAKMLLLHDHPFNLIKQ